MSYKSCCCSRKAGTVIFACLGAVLIIVGLILKYKIVPPYIDYQVKLNVELKPGSLVYEEWVNSSTPIYMHYYVFDLKNPQEVFAGTDIPDLEQKGPYSYREIRSNEVLQWDSDNSVVTFMPNRTYIFDPKTSCDGCDDKKDNFTTVNIPLLTTALWMNRTNYKQNYPLCFTFIDFEVSKTGEALFQTKSVYEILWGYNDPVLEFALNATKLTTCPIPEGLNSSLVQLQYNNTYYGISAINTGRTVINKLEQFTMWREKSHLSWWSDKYANMINGTDGTQFAPKVSKNDKLYGFSPEICRSFYAEYESTVTVKDIKLYRFSLPAELYLTGDQYPPNKGFCVPPHCLPTGLLNISLCQPLNPPIVMSPPHFYHGNESLVKAVRGIHPNESKDETFIDVEPITGIVMQAAKRLQVNVALEPVNVFAVTDGKFDPVFLPVMYASETALISADKAATFRHKVYLPLKIAAIVEYSLIGLGALFIVIAICLVILTLHKKNAEKKDKYNERSPLVEDKDKVVA